MKSVNETLNGKKMKAKHFFNNEEGFSEGELFMSFVFVLVPAYIAELIIKNYLLPEWNILLLTALAML